MIHLKFYNYQTVKYTKTTKIGHKYMVCFNVYSLYEYFCTFFTFSPCRLDLRRDHGKV